MATSLGKMSFLTQLQRNILWIRVSASHMLHTAPCNILQPATSHELQTPSSHGFHHMINHSLKSTARLYRNSCSLIQTDNIQDCLLKPDGKVGVACQVQPRRYAGHSHWQNVRHIKGANDAAKKKVTDQFVRKIKLAIADGGSNDPKVNSTLAKIMEQAKNADVPKSTIERAVKKSNEAEVPIQVVEARGPATSFLCIKVQSVTFGRTKQLLQKELKKFGGQVGEPGAAKHAFEHKGIVKVELEGGMNMDEDKAMDIAIEVGAEDVSCTTEDDCNMLEFVCDPRDVHTVRRALDKMEYNVTYADDRFIPSTTVALNKEALEYVQKAYEKLFTNVEGVVEIFDNIVEESS